MSRHRMILVAWVLLSSIGGRVVQGSDLYAAQIKPILRERCFACHGALKQESDLRLDSLSPQGSGSAHASVIVPGSPATSPLWQRIIATDLSQRMPPEGEPLAPDQIETIRRWIQEGAVVPDEDPPERDPREHWAFQPPIQSAIPEVGNPAWRANPIDAFLGEAIQARGLLPQPDVDKRLWLRRVTLDLIGLPPTPDEYAQFFEDRSESAYETVVHRLLESPHYGERWGRHWMDIWRYSDAWGLGPEIRNSQKHLWRWRDWILESLNADVGYDQMIREMIAADELYPADPSRLRATGYLSRQYFKFNRTSWLDETIEHTTKGMLGLTFNCSKCHDHKYDPISQKDYYRMRAIFEPYQVRTDLVAGEVDIQKDGLSRVFDCNLEAATLVHIRGDERRADPTQRMEPAVPQFLRSGDFQIVPVSLPSESIHPGLRASVLDSYVQAAEAKIVALRATFENLESSRQATLDRPDASDTERDIARLTTAVAGWELDAARKEREALPRRAAADRAKVDSLPAEWISSAVVAAAMATREVELSQAEANLSRAQLMAAQATDNNKAECAERIEAAEKGVEVARQRLESPGEAYEPIRGSEKTAESNLENDESRRKPFPATSTGRRSALAAWLTDRQNPLTARVAVNHIWARHFGKPLVATVFDFGRKGSPPTHPKLLDWLAVELMDHRWSMKHLHRLITTSQAYRRSSSSAHADADTVANDPENRFYWRANPLRMESEIVRDSLLALAGKLDHQVGGPSIAVTDEQACRRSLYFIHSHNDHHSFLSMFDDASVLDCYRRAESIVPQQALALENSQLTADLCAAIENRIHSFQPEMTDPEFVRIAFETILGFEPTVEERSMSYRMMDAVQRVSEGTDRSDQGTRRRRALIRALLNHNDFVTIR